MGTDLAERVAVVTGGARGCGRAIAVELGRLGATVYVTGRSTRAGRSPLNRPETIEETAERVSSVGGAGIAVRCDHTVVSDVDDLVQRIEAEQGGRLDIVVDDLWGGDHLVEMGVPFWASDLDNALAAMRNGVESHLITAHRLVPLLLRRERGLLIEITDNDSDAYVGAAIPYYLTKCALRRLASALHAELAGTPVTTLALTPGFLRSEAMLEHFGVTEQNWRDAADPANPENKHFGISETPTYLGRAVAALATDPAVADWSGKSTSSWELARHYGFTDVDGSRPDCGRYFADAVFGDHPEADPADYR